MKTGKVFESVLDSGVRFIKFLGMGKKDTREYRQVAPHGFDSCPVKDRVLVYAETGEVGKAVVIGYINKNQIAAVGETRIFSTNADGVEQISLHLKNDGTAEFGGNEDNFVRFRELRQGFNALVNDFNALVTEHNTLVFLFNAHVHAGVTVGAGVTGTTATPGTDAASTSASIDASKIDEIKTSA